MVSMRSRCSQPMSSQVTTCPLSARRSCAFAAITAHAVKATKPNWDEGVMP
jgi:hypothetical protein